MSKGGLSPNDTMLVIQRLQSKVVEGKLHQDTFDAVYDLIDDVTHWPPPDLDGVLTELFPVVKTRIREQAILAAHSDFARGGDMAVSRALLDVAAHLGSQGQIGGLQLGRAGFKEIENALKVARLPTGIFELDVGLDGGMTCGGLGVGVGAPGGGKSMTLIHGAAESIKCGMVTGFVTLELPQHWQFARLVACLTGIEISAILENPTLRAEADRRLALIQHQLGFCEIAEFAPHVTTVAEIIEWIDMVEQRIGLKMHTLYVDYADKLYHPGIRADNEYLAMRYVYEALRRDIAVKRDMWVWTASQANRATKETKKRIDMHNVADSMHKVRIADLVVTMTFDEDTNELTYFVAKNRLGRSRFSVGPLPTDFGRGRITYLTKELGPW